MIETTTERKLASIQKVHTIEPIEGADNIEVIHVLGWELIAKKGEFQEGDLCVFFEIDSVLPETEWSEFLRAKKFHVKTMKLDKFGVISQGLALPLNILDEHKSAYHDWTEGDDVTTILTVTKYEAPSPVNFAVGIIGTFHPFIPKTDEPRIQSNPKMLDELWGKPYFIAQKLDGTSCTVVKDDSGIHVYSRNMEVNDTSMYWQVARAEGLLDVVEAHPYRAIQGEIVGENIQGNRLGLTGKHFFAFNILDLNKLIYEDFLKFIRDTEAWGIRTVPMLDVSTSFDYTLEELEAYAESLNYESGFPQEGIVVRPQIEMRSLSNRSRLSFKVINKKFLVKIGE